MGELYGRWSRALDGNLAILTTAKLYCYDSVATTTPKTTYSDAALATPHANPISADPSGRFPQVFAPDGQSFYLVLRSNLTGSGGVIVEQFNNVESLGSVSGDILGVDFGNGGKWQVRGDTGAGKAHMEFGDPDPDVIGGSGIVGGWDGTQLDDLLLDTAALRTTGHITENEKKLSSVVYTPAVTFTTAATVDIALPNDPAGCLSFEIPIWDFLQSANANLYARLSYDNAVTFKAGAADYFSHAALFATAGIVITADLTEAQATLAVDIQGTATLPGSGIIRVITPPSGTVATRIEGEIKGIAHTGALGQAFFNAYGKGGYGKATHLRLFAASGTITGKYLVRPQRGFGEP